MIFKQKHHKHKTWHTVAINDAGKQVARIYHNDHHSFRVDTGKSYNDFPSRTLAFNYCKENLNAG